MKRRKYTKEIAKNIYCLLEYYSSVEIGKMLGIHTSNMIRMLRRFGYINTNKLKYRYKRFDYLTEPEKAYIAGIIDGEGCITQEYRVNVTNINYEVLIWLKNKLGGAITKIKTYKEHHKSCWRWMLGSIATRGLILSILPYLIIKKEKALGLISDWENSKWSSMTRKCTASGQKPQHLL